MNKNQKLVKKFLAGNLDGTRTFKQMTSENEEEIKRAKEIRVKRTGRGSFKATKEWLAPILVLRKCF